mmetsp:Transcript_29360/g.47318  ORF Transcript_29360/g.47318 Transcript_29360/m.47318 type:complete len:259 (-) Transcript_29360:997-1773(-)
MFYSAQLAVPPAFSVTHYGVLQCVVMCCSVLECVAVCCSVEATILSSAPRRCVLHCAADCCSVLQSVIVCCSALQCGTQRRGGARSPPLHAVGCCAGSALQCAAECYTVLQSATLCCSLQLSGAAGRDLHSGLQRLQHSWLQRRQEPFWCRLVASAPLPPEVSGSTLQLGVPLARAAIWGYDPWQSDWRERPRKSQAATRNDAPCGIPSASTAPNPSTQHLSSSVPVSQHSWLATSCPALLMSPLPMQSWGHPLPPPP